MGGSVFFGKSVSTSEDENNSLAVLAEAKADFIQCIDKIKEKIKSIITCDDELDPILAFYATIRRNFENLSLTELSSEYHKINTYAGQSLTKSAFLKLKPSLLRAHIDIYRTVEILRDLTPIQDALYSAYKEFDSVIYDTQIGLQSVSKRTDQTDNISFQHALAE